ncbi:MAG: hypothetical protein AAF621_07405, partial [Pseudomonadota bacterium]
LNTVYGALAAVTVLTFIPMLSMAVAALALFLLIFIGLYVVKGKTQKDSVVENHMIFLIRTIWITSLFSIITMTAATIYLLPNYNPDALLPCGDSMMGILSSNPEASMAVLSDALQPCMDQFVSDNQTVLINATIIGAGPIIIYFLYRLFKGGSRAIKGYRLANPKGWF